jgi:glycosyltransferase involved in cell wall biosynthesis
MPRISVVIPTRARPDTLAHALRTAVEQRDVDLEIIVHESGDDPRIAAVVAAVGDERTRHLKTGQPVPMTTNWERALEAATGDFVTFIGDDDGLMPGACARAGRILAEHRAEMISWRPAVYYWPRYLRAHQQNRLQVHLEESDAIEVKSSRRALDLVYAFREDYARLPMVYNSFVGRAVVDRVRARLGRYFVGDAPDVCSGIVNAFFSDSFLLSRRPMSISGLSHHSTGHRHFFGDAAQRRAAKEDAFHHLSVHPTLHACDNLTIFLGNEMLMVKERAFPHEGPSVDLEGLLWSALLALDSGLEDVEAGLADISAVARRNGIAPERFVLSPTRPERGDGAPQGVFAAGIDGVMIDIDGSALGVANVHDATRVLETLLPPDRPPVVRPESPQLRAIPASSLSTAIDFGDRGNGALLLRFGWGGLEPWGVWTVGPRAEVVLPLEGRSTRPVKIRIEGQMFVHARAPAARGRVAINQGRPVPFEATLARPEVGIELAVDPRDMAKGSRLVLHFEIDRPTAPADVAVSADTRRLGLGLRRIVVAS